MGIKTTQNFTLISKLLRKMWKTCLQKSYSQNKCEKSEVLLFYTTKLQKCLANNFFWVDFFFDYFHRFEISVKFCEFWIIICQKRTKNFWGHWVHIWVYVRTSRMQIRKKWLNQLKNFFNKRFREYYLASFCWWISSSCENHCTLMRIYMPMYVLCNMPF